MVTLVFGAGGSIPFFSPTLSTDYLTNKVLDPNEWQRVYKHYVSLTDPTIVIPELKDICDLIKQITEVRKNANFEEIAEILDKVCSWRFDNLPENTFLASIVAVLANDSLKQVSRISGCGGSIRIDGLLWAKMNVGWTPTNLHGETYTFDDAQKACPNGWRTPTKEEYESLSAHTSGGTTFNGMNGCWYSGSKTYSESNPAVFFPIGDVDGRNWSSTMNGSKQAFCFLFTTYGLKRMNSSDISETFWVRCVRDL